jgi:uncharacterized protein (TIGR03437 family)
MRFPKHPYLAICIAFAAGLASAQTLTVDSGDGQIVAESFVTKDYLVVVLKNAQGVPMANQTVTWTLNGPGSITTNPQIQTDSEGKARTNFVGPGSLGSFSAFTQSVITASAFGVGVDFTVTTSKLGQINGFVGFELLYPTLADLPYIVPAGGSPQPIRVFVRPDLGLQGGVGIPHVSVMATYQPTGAPTEPTIRCNGPGGVAFTDASGIATCNPVVTGRGTGSFSIFIGGSSEATAYRSLSNLAFRVTKGPLAVLRVGSGNNQSGNAGAALAGPLVAIAEDIAGNTPPEPLPSLVWEPVVPGTATLSNVVSTPDDNGRVSARATLGNTPGNIQIRVRNQTGTIQALFTATVSLNFTGISKLSGDIQDTVVNTDFPQPLVVQVSTDRGNVPGIPVQFAVASGGATVPSAPVLTDANGRAQATVHAGATPSLITVTAKVGNFTATFNLTSRLPGPGITSSSFFNAAGGQSGGVSPLALVSMFGGGLATGLQGCTGANQILGPMPFVLANVSVQFGSVNAPLYAICNLGIGAEYVVLQVPAELAVGSTSVTARVGSGSTTVQGIPVTAVSPGLFETVMQDGRKRVVAVRPDGSYVSLTNRANRGEKIKIFVIGLGIPATSSGQRVGTNQAGPSTADALSPYEIIVGVNNAGVPDEVKAAYSPDIVGVYVVTFTLPDDAPSGDSVPFAVAARVGDSTVFGNGSSIPIQ